MGVVEVAIGLGSRSGRFRVEVVRSPAGEASSETALDAVGLLAGRKQFEQTLLVSAVAPRQILTPAESVVRDTGQALFRALLDTGEVAGRYRASAALADERGEELRVVLQARCSGAGWAAVGGHVRPGAGGYVCRQHQLVRHVPVAAVPPPLAVDGPLRILGVAAAPRGLAVPGAGQEREHLERAVAGLAVQGLATLAWAPEATWAGLHEMLLAGPWHVLHFIGHGDFDPARDEGLLALEREDGWPDLMEASRLASLLRQARPMPRLVMLNSCSGGTVSAQDLFSGTAAALARSGVGAVAAMQYAISDQAAVAFARGFYAALARGRKWTRRCQRAGSRSWAPAARPWNGSPRSCTCAASTPVCSRSRPLAACHPRDPPRYRSPCPGQATSRTVTSRIPSNRGRVLTGHAFDVRGVAFSPDGTLLATASADKTARLWDTATGQATRTLTGHAIDVRGVAFSPDGTLLATASADKTVRLWDTATGHAIRSLAGHSKAVHGVAFSPNGTLVATASADKTARLWDTATGHAIRTLAGHTSDVAAVAFSPDGTLVATASADKTARLWDTATGTHVRTLVGHTKAVYAVTFSPDGPCSPPPDGQEGPAVGYRYRCPRPHSDRPHQRRAGGSVQPGRPPARHRRMGQEGPAMGYRYRCPRPHPDRPHQRRMGSGVRARMAPCSPPPAPTGQPGCGA